MNPLLAPIEAVKGWGDILGGRDRDAWRRHFRLDAAGLAVAVVWYIAILGLAIAIQSLLVMPPTASQLLAAMVLNTLPLVALALAIALTVIAIRPGPGVGLALMVTGVWLFALLPVIGLASLLISPLLGYSVFGIVGYLLYRAGRVVGGMGAGTSVAFAVFTLVVLVASSPSLYMQAAAAPPA